MSQSSYPFPTRSPSPPASSSSTSQLFLSSRASPLPSSNVQQIRRPPFITDTPRPFDEQSLLGGYSLTEAVAAARHEEVRLLELRRLLSKEAKRAQMERIVLFLFKEKLEKEQSGVIDADGFSSLSEEDVAVLQEELNSFSQIDNSQFVQTASNANTLTNNDNSMTSTSTTNLDPTSIHSQVHSHSESHIPNFSTSYYHRNNQAHYYDTSSSHDQQITYSQNSQVVYGDRSESNHTHNRNTREMNMSGGNYLAHYETSTHPLSSNSSSSSFLPSLSNNSTNSSSLSSQNPSGMSYSQDELLTILAQVVDGHDGVSLDALLEHELGIHETNHSQTSTHSFTAHNQEIIEDESQGQVAASTDNLSSNNNSSSNSSSFETLNHQQ